VVGAPAGAALMGIHLAGGGWPLEDGGAVYRPFLEELSARAVAAGRTDGPRLAIVIVHDGDGAAPYSEIVTALGSLEEIDPVAVLAPVGSPIDSALLADVDGILVWGGLVSAYRDSLAEAFGEIRRQVAAGIPYFGQSAGSVIAADHAVIGGWKIGDVPVGPPHAGGGLEQVTIGEGLGLIDLAIDVHAAQWGTVGRLIAATEAGIVDGGVAIDEHTAFIVGEGALRVVGRGSVWKISSDSGSVRVSTLGSE
jgi:cyanophycinase